MKDIMDQLVAHKMSYDYTKATGINQLKVYTSTKTFTVDRVVVDGKGMFEVHTKGSEKVHTVKKSEVVPLLLKLSA